MRSVLRCSQKLDTHIPQHLRSVFLLSDSVFIYMLEMERIEKKDVCKTEKNLHLFQGFYLFFYRRNTVHKLLSLRLILMYG